MDKVLWFFIDFVLLFLLCFIVQRVFLDKFKKSYSKLKKNDEIILFINRYNLDIKKTDFKTIKYTLYCINSFILSFAATLILYINNIFIKIIVSVVVVFSLMYCLFEIFGNKLKKKEDNIE